MIETRIEARHPRLLEKKTNTRGEVHGSGLAAIALRASREADALGAFAQQLPRAIELACAHTQAVMLMHTPLNRPCARPVNRRACPMVAGLKLVAGGDQRCDSGRER